MLSTVRREEYWYGGRERQGEVGKDVGMEEGRDGRRRVRGRKKWRKNGEREGGRKRGKERKRQGESGGMRDSGGRTRGGNNDKFCSTRNGQVPVNRDSEDG